MSKQILGVTIRTWWTLVICIAVSSLGTWAAIDHANANDRRNRDRTNQQFRHSILLSQRKFQQAIRISTAQNAYSTNKSVCTLRPFLSAALEARLAAVKNAKSEADRKLNQTAADTYRRLLQGEITVPPSFKCASLPNKPTK